MPGDGVGAGIMIGAPIGEARSLRGLRDGEDRLGKIAGRGRAPGLVVDDAKLVALGAEPEHGLDEIGAERAIDPGRAQDQVLAVGRADGALAGFLAPRIGALRIDLVLLVVGNAGRAIEHIVGGDMDERHVRLGSLLGEDCRAVAVHLKGAIRLALGLVDGGIGRGIDDDGRRVPGDDGSDGVRSQISASLWVSATMWCPLPEAISIRWSPTWPPAPKTMILDPTA